MSDVILTLTGYAMARLSFHMAYVHTLRLFVQIVPYLIVVWALIMTREPSVSVNRYVGAMLMPLFVLWVAVMNRAFWPVDLLGMVAGAPWAGVRNALILLPFVMAVPWFDHAIRGLSPASPADGGYAWAVWGCAFAGLFHVTIYAYSMPGAQMAVYRFITPILPFAGSHEWLPAEAFLVWPVALAGTVVIHWRGGSAG